jgi:hypothetical protein
MLICNCNFLNSIFKIVDTVAPEFLDPQNVTVKFYETEKNGSLLCTAKGYPAPDIMWLRGDEVLKSS